MATSNGNGHAADTPMVRVFPEALTPLAQADPEIYALVQDEKKRQWCVRSCCPPPFFFSAAVAAAVCVSGRDPRAERRLCTPPPPLSAVQSLTHLPHNKITDSRTRRRGVELIASENFTSLPVMEALGSCFTNKYR